MDSIIKYTQIALIIILSVALTFYVISSQAKQNKIDSLLGENALYKDAATKNEKAIETLKNQSEQLNKSVADLKKRSAARVNEARKKEREALNVAKDKDGDVAPVMRDFIRRLRGEANNNGS